MGILFWPPGRRSILFPSNLPLIPARRVSVLHQRAESERKRADAICIALQCGLGPGEGADYGMLATVRRAMASPSDRSDRERLVPTASSPSIGGALTIRES